MANTSVFGLYTDYSSVENSVDTLKRAGFRNTDVSVLFPQHIVSKDLALEKDVEAPEEAPAGVKAGGKVGGALGWLMGVGALAIPGLGPFIAAGPMMAELKKAGTAVGGAVGKLTYTLISLGIPVHQAEHYEGHVKDGGILLSVHSDDQEWTTRARRIMEQTGAQHMSSTTVFSAADAKIDSPLAYTAAGSEGGITAGELHRLID